MPITKLRPSFTLDEERLAQLGAVVPEAFADGKINWDALHEALGDHLEDESADAEHFGLFWSGKRQARRLASQPGHGALIPVPGQGVDEATTRNIFIEGENLEVLKLLLKAYAGQVKLIYIDPPYNTGNDLIYPDDFSEPLEAYLRRTGQTNEQGEPLTTNTRASGRFHSNWLNMIYPRLRLARQLLRQDGVIFVSIDDNEASHLRDLMDEIFGQENFLAQVIWQKVYSPRMDAKGYSADHDYILVYRRSGEAAAGRIAFEQNLKQFTGVDSATGKRYRPRSLRKEGKHSTRADRPNLWYPLTAPDGSRVWPIRSDGSDGCWRMGQAKYDLLSEKGLIEWVKTEAQWQVYVKQLYDEKATKPPATIWLHAEVGHNHEAVEEIRHLFGEPLFDNPKPTRLIRRMLDLATNSEDEDLIVDFFAGSCTTADAILQQNLSDGGDRRLIMVQLQEPTPEHSAARRAGYATIADVAKERIRRAIAKLKTERQGEVDLQPAQDLGFRVYRLDRSHFRRWHDYEGASPAEVGTLFDQFETPLVDGWTTEALLVETMLLEGFPLDSAVTPQPTFAHNTVHLVESDGCEHRLFVCLDPAIHDHTLANLSPVGKDVFVCLDSALSDEAKLRLADACDLKVI